MKNSDRDRIKKWVETWKRAGSALDEVKRRELRAYNYFENQALVDEMLQWAVDHQKIRLTTGMVEQQRLFMKMRKAIF
ncbi:MAG: hypothetical protein KKC23_00210 [Proteobacteria bacterium]|nr:hypothetical protein [Pseudomonadota bacterium]